ncbi:DNA translocase FtsK [Oceanobacillus rekensis]|uniref:DNA translocase FtsK n=1 Tax=Oceanobacillus rekensis TaxID=937927 RepID=UPI000B43C306|nr:DNA translocase FtsK [Oceanobacillus rekensis]
MWNEWKKKIKNIFTEEVEIEVEEVVEVKSKDNHNSGTQQLKAKMMYQYPERNSFRFPVIPDAPKRKKTKENPQSKVIEDFPPYQKMQNKRTERKPREARKDTEKRTNNEPMAGEGRKVYKKDPNVPFQLSEVPSPIYGFQNKKPKQEIEDVPAYQRKDSEQEMEFATKDLTITDSPDDTFHPLETEQHAQPQETPEESITDEDEEVEKDEPNNFSELPQKEAAATVEPVEPVEPVEKELKEPVTDISTDRDVDAKRKINPISSKETRNAYEKASSDSKPEPFNVIMTPRDKKNLFDRQKKQSMHEQQQRDRKEEQQRIEQAEKLKLEKKRRAQREKLRQEQLSAQVENNQDDEQPAQKQSYLPYHLLNDPIEKSNDDQIWVNQQQELLARTLKYFNVRAKVVRATQGPSVTRFEVHPEMGVKVSKIKNLSDDLKLNMAARDIRIEAPIPGKNTVGIEIPNRKSEMVGLQGIFETDDFKESKSPLSIALGLTIEGYPKITNIQKMPHGLIAGATGSGKSVCINTILISLIYKASHEDVKFLLIDPKMVELAPYNGIPHLVAPVITDVKAATQSLKWAVNEMEERYEKFVQESVRDIERYNQKVIKQGRGNEKMPFIVIVIDELADLMMMSPQDVENSISRIAQKARACGIHLLLATQRPSVDVITGLIKANIPTRIAFSVSSQIDSRTIIDSSGAEKLLGKGDMLFVENGTGQSVRLQGPFVSDEEIERVTSYARTIAEPNYLFEQEQLLEQMNVEEDEDELMDDAIEFVLSHNSASTSLMQRHFKIGYNRAARLIDSLEAKGIISGQNGSKPREVLITQSQLDEL